MRVRARSLFRPQYLRSRLRYWIMPQQCAGLDRPPPSKSAMVRATLECAQPRTQAHLCEACRIKSLVVCRAVSFGQAVVQGAAVDSIVAMPTGSLRAASTRRFDACRIAPLQMYRRCGHRPRAPSPPADRCDPLGPLIRWIPLDLHRRAPACIGSKLSAGAWVHGRYQHKLGW